MDVSSLIMCPRCGGELDTACKCENCLIVAKKQNAVSV